VQEHDRVLAAAEQQARTFALRGELAENVNRLVFESLEMASAIADALTVLESAIPDKPLPPALSLIV
jgi:uncharacterized protein Yka (UPF0111/DUF47 family)